MPLAGFAVLRGTFSHPPYFLPATIEIRFRIRISVFITYNKINKGANNRFVNGSILSQEIIRIYSNKRNIAFVII